MGEKTREKILFFWKILLVGSDSKVILFGGKKVTDLSDRRRKHSDWGRGRLAGHWIRFGVVDEI